MTPPAATAATTFADVQLAAEPVPTTWSGCDVSTGPDLVRGAGVTDGVGEERDTRLRFGRNDREDLAVGLGVADVIAGELAGAAGVLFAACRFELAALQPAVNRSTATAPIATPRRVTAGIVSKPQNAQRTSDGQGSNPMVTHQSPLHVPADLVRTP
jgi:hypothetical protein